MEGQEDKVETNDIIDDTEADDADFLHEQRRKTVNRPPNTGRPNNFAVSRASHEQQDDFPELNKGEEINKSIEGAIGVCFQNNGKYRSYNQIGNAGNVVPQETDKTTKEHFSFWPLATNSTPVSGSIQDGNHDIREHIKSLSLNNFCSNMEQLTDTTIVNTPTSVSLPSGNSNVSYPPTNSITSKSSEFKSSSGLKPYSGKNIDPFYSCARGYGARQEHSPRQESTDEV